MKRDLPDLLIGHLRLMQFKCSFFSKIMFNSAVLLKQIVNLEIIKSKPSDVKHWHFKDNKQTSKSHKTGCICASVVCCGTAAASVASGIIQVCLVATWA